MVYTKALCFILFFPSYDICTMNEMIYEMNHILNCGYEIKYKSYDPCSYQCNFSNGIEKPEKFRTSIYDSLHISFRSLIHSPWEH